MPSLPSGLTFRFSEQCKKMQFLNNWTASVIGIMHTMEITGA
jgi:hypothetical protein